MPGTLYVVATPLGNLEDITFRAVRVLREVAVIAAEDTRRTARLLQHYSITTPTTSLHEHNERIRTPSLIARLQGGESVALVSDAGTPLVSDPGAVLVAAAHGAGVRVEPIPGPSALMAILSAAGLPADEVVFLGFPPSRSGARKKWLSRLSAEPRLLVFYEAPHRIRETLAAALEILGDRQVAVGRELTKMHEELVVRPISVYLGEMREPRGEYVVAVAPPVPGVEAALDLPSPAELLDELGRMPNDTYRSRREAVRALAQKYGVTPRRMYELLEAGRDTLGLTGE